MTACLNFATFLGLSAALACKYKERLVNVIPISTAALILVLLALAFFRALYLIDAAAVLTLAACAVFFARSFGKNSGRELLSVLFSPSSVAFYCIVILAFFLMRNIPVADSDDLGCWALEAKSIFFYDGFPPKFRNAAFSYGRYFPGTSLFRWWVCHLFGQFRDGFLFVGSGWLFIFLLAPVLACCSYGMCFAPLASIAHYGMPVFLGVLIFLLYRMLAAARSRFCRLTVLAAFMAFAVSCTCLWTVYYRVVNTTELNRQTEAWHSELAERFDDLLAQARENERGRILVIYDGDRIADYTEGVRLQYLAAPCSVVIFELDAEGAEPDSRLAELEEVFEQSHPNMIYVMCGEEAPLSGLIPQWLASGVTVAYE